MLLQSLSPLALIDSLGAVPILWIFCSEFWEKEQICVTYDSELQGSNQFGQLAFIAETKQQGLFFFICSLEWIDIVIVFLQPILIQIK